MAGAWRHGLALAGLALVMYAGIPSAMAEPVALVGHGGPVMALDRTRDGAMLTGSFDNAVGLWPGGAAGPVWLDGHEAAVKTVLALPGGRAASAGDDQVILIWDLASGAPVHRLAGHRGSIAGLAVSPDGAVLASAGWDGRIGLWDLATGQPLRWIDHHTAPVNAVAFAPDGSRLFSASADGTVQEFDTATGAPLGLVARHGFPVGQLLLDAQAGWLAYGAQDGGTRVVSLADGRDLADLSLDRRPVLALAQSPDGGLLAVGDGEGHVMVVETARWTIAHDFKAAERGPVWALAFSPDGGRLVAGGIDDAAAIFAVGGGAAALGTRQRAFLRDPATMTNGERQFSRKCSVCHTLTGDGARKAGPPLAGVFGRPSGAIAGYPYSETLATGDIVWSAETIDALFRDGPDRFVPGSKMPVQRIANDGDRRDLIEYLRQHTQ